MFTGAGSVEEEGILFFVGAPKINRRMLNPGHKLVPYLRAAVFVASFGNAN